MTPKQALKKSYQTLSPWSDRQRWEFYNNLKHIKFFQASVPAGADVLDIGCGIGIFSLALTYLGYHVTGLDKYIFLPDNYLSVSHGLNDLMAVWQRERLKILPADVYTHETADHYDCVVNVAVIEHQTDPKKFLRACIQYLKPGGLFFCVTPNTADLLNRVRFLAGRSAHRELRAFFDAGDKFVGHWREYTLPEVEQMCIWSGLKIIKSKNYRTSPLWNGKDQFPRNILLALFRLAGDLVPGGRDTNSVIAQK